MTRVSGQGPLGGCSSGWGCSLLAPLLAVVALAVVLAVAMTSMPVDPPGPQVEATP